MKNILPKFFTKINHQTVYQLPNQQILVMGVFSKSSTAKQSSMRLIALTDTHLLYYQDHTINKIRRISELTFETRFQIIREEWKDPKIPGTPIGLKFEKQGYQPMFLYSNDLENISIWKDFLENKINQRGFHSLFKPIRKIGKGNFASVYLAERLEDKKLVAVKAFSKQAVFSQEKGKQSLINEMNLMRKLCHTNIMRLYGVYESENSIYMTVQYLQGGQLFNKIQNKHKFTAEEIRKIMRGLLSGLNQMHSKRIMHRDLKPENILLRYLDDFEVVIADFGLATWADQQKYLFVRCGTPGYVAPQIVNIKNLNAKSDPICDIFSVGLIFHILLLGKSVFPGKTYNEVLAQNRACDFNLETAQYKTLDESAHHLLTRMLEKNPNMRISANEALKHAYFLQMEMEYEEKQNNKKKYFIVESSINRKKELLKEDSCIKFVPKYLNSPKYEEYALKSIKSGKQQHSESQKLRPKDLNRIENKRS